MKYARKNGAIGVVFYAAKGEPVTQLAWNNTWYVKTPGSMISFADGMKLKDLLRFGHVRVHVQYETKTLENIYFGSDHHGDLAEGGFSLYASLVFLDYQAQWLVCVLHIFPIFLLFFLFFKVIIIVTVLSSKY